MQRPSALVASVAIAFFLFSPIACFSQDEQSHDCCGCMGDHGPYECIDGECVDGSKTHDTSYLPSPPPSAPRSTSSPPPPPPPPFDDASASTECSFDLDCPFGRHCEGGVCAGCLSDLDCVVGARCVDGACM
ncbi:MAG TPA: hypothetical protein VIF62_32740 [Labilithrix sp.]